MMKKTISLPVIAVLFPLLLMLVWLAKLYAIVIFGTDIRLKITGYDPRDLFSGDYFQYRADYGISPCENFTGYNPEVLKPDFSSHCACFKKLNVEEDNKAFWVGDCAERPQGCDLYLEGQCKYGNFVAGIERYYFPQQFEKELGTLLRQQCSQQFGKELATSPRQQCSAIVKVFQGKGIVQKIEIKGMDILEYAKQKK